MNCRNQYRAGGTFRTSWPTNFYTVIPSIAIVWSCSILNGCGAVIDEEPQVKKPLPSAQRDVHQEGLASHLATDDRQSNDEVDRTSDVPLRDQPNIELPDDPVSQLTDPVEPQPIKSKNPLIRGIEGLLGSDRIIQGDQKDGLQEMLEEADDTLTRVKRENRAALKNMNRQIRLNQRRPPNVLLILADDLGPSELGCYGQTQIQTPHLDRLAREGIRFTGFYANSPDGAISRWCLMSGRHTGHLPKEVEWPPALQSSNMTLAEMMWQASYDTAWIGKWGMRGDTADDYPLSHGFDEWWGTADTLDQTDLFPEIIWSNHSKIGISANADGKQGIVATEIFTEEAVRYLEREDERRPFFLVVSYPLPSANVETRNIPDTPYANENWPAGKKQHAARITQLDLEIGRLLETLDRRNLANNTVVIVTSDNSPHLGTPGREYFASTDDLRMEPGKLHEGALRVPCLMRWSGRTKAGSVSDYPATLCDLYPTIAEIASAQRRPRTLDGQSLVKIFGGSDAQRDDLLYWQMESPSFTQAVRKGEWKVVRPAGVDGMEDLELYNLKTDPGETTNVAAEHPEVLKSVIISPQRNRGV
ncbi:MAG: sulfatase-like hydrolase/transferase [Planctomycetota bacterium]|nr:sulfatase-like hydrolase/transferase [Planctomycetota bacterium]MDA1211505.1 sulfatase-like hydrolase/transferase [Planctomycetota bacterium]